MTVDVYGTTVLESSVGLYIGNVNSGTRVSSNVRKVSFEESGENHKA